MNQNNTGQDVAAEVNTGKSEADHTPVKTTTMKTVRQWLETIADDEIREKALENMDNDPPYTGDEVADFLQDALIFAFNFGKTPEGFDYWDKVYDQIEAGTIQTREVEGQE